MKCTERTFRRSIEVDNNRRVIDINTQPVVRVAVSGSVLVMSSDPVTFFAQHPERPPVTRRDIGRERIMCQVGCARTDVLEHLCVCVCLLL